MVARTLGVNYSSTQDGYISLKIEDNYKVEAAKNVSIGRRGAGNNDYHIRLFTTFENSWQELNRRFRSETYETAIVIIMEIMYILDQVPIATSRTPAARHIRILERIEEWFKSTVSAPVARSPTTRITQSGVGTAFGRWVLVPGSGTTLTRVSPQPYI